MSNYREYQSTLHVWEIQKQISELAKHIESCAKSTENSIWKHFGLHAQASSPTQSSSEEQIAYLVRSMDALRSEFRELSSDGRITDRRLSRFLTSLRRSGIDVHGVTVDDVNDRVDVEYTSDSDKDVEIRMMWDESLLPHGAKVRALRLPSRSKDPKSHATDNQSKES